MSQMKCDVITLENKSAGEIEDFGASTPMGRPAQPEEVAPAIEKVSSTVTIFA